MYVLPYSRVPSALPSDRTSYLCKAFFETECDVFSVPIGAYDVNTEGATLEMEPPHPYVDALVDQFDSPIEDSSQAEDAVRLYRRVLAAQPDRSVAISSVGLLTNLAALLRSGPDDNSPLDGRALVAQKVGDNLCLSKRSL